MKVAKVLRKSTESARVILDNGWSVKIPLAFVSDEFTETDFVQVTTNYKVDMIHRTMYKPKRVPRVPQLVRDMSKFNALEEFNLLRSITAKNAVMFNYRLTDEALDDLTSDIFLHFWERNLFQGYNASTTSYQPYLSRAVRNYLIDKFRSSTFKAEKKKVSLDKPIVDDTGTATLMDLIESPEINTADDWNYDQDLLKALQNAVYALDCDGTGLKGVTYSAIFKTVFFPTQTSFEDLVRKSGYSRTTIISRRDKMIEWLRPVFNEWRNIC